MQKSTHSKMVILLFLGIPFYQEPYREEWQILDYFSLGSNVILNSLSHTQP